jgi:hypothetical protein
MPLRGGVSRQINSAPAVMNSESARIRVSIAAHQSYFCNCLAQCGPFYFSRLPDRIFNTMLCYNETNERLEISQPNQRRNSLMQNRRIILGAILSALAFLPGVQAISPTPDGCYPNFTTAEGCNALNALSTGVGNTGLGWRSLFSVGDGSFNTGVGAGALLLNTGDNNTAVGAVALLLNTTGTSNTAVGTSALLSNAEGTNNNAVGDSALLSNTSGTFNNAHGHSALTANVDGSENNAFGDLALSSNTTGGTNTGIGDDALFSVTTGNSNTALGDEAGSNLVDGEGNIYIGAQVQAGATDEIQFIRIGDDTAFAFPYDTFIAGIFDRVVDVGTAVPVFVDDTGKLGTILVDAVGNKVATPQAMLNESRNQQKRIAELEGTVARLAAMVKEQAAQIQKVSARVEMNAPATKVANNR